MKMFIKSFALRISGLLLAAVVTVVGFSLMIILSFYMEDAPMVGIFEVLLGYMSLFGFLIATLITSIGATAFIALCGQIVFEVLYSCYLAMISILSRMRAVCSLMFKKDESLI